MSPDEPRYPVITVDQTSAVPPFEQVRAQFAAQIGAGQLVAGTRLPTVRRLAQDLGIAVNTAARAYRELEAAGLIETRGRGGSVVTANAGDAQARVRSAALDLAAAARAAGLDRAQTIRHLDSALAELAPG